jgi:hypothetical protein
MPFQHQHQGIFKIADDKVLSGINIHPISGEGVEEAKRFLLCIAADNSFYKHVGGNMKLIALHTLQYIPYGILSKILRDIWDIL